MKLCEDHFKKLKKGLEEQGLSRFVAPNEAAVAERLQATTAKESFDPLMGACLAIYNNSLNVAGLSVMRPNEDGSERCPLCFLVSKCLCGQGDACDFHKWVDHAIDDQKELALGLGLIVPS